jgi:hypothetical protein
MQVTIGKCFQYVPESKKNLPLETDDSPTIQESLHWKSQMKTMLIIFFDVKGIMHFELIPRGQDSQSSLLFGNTEAIT